jgi:DNA-binding transcriptional MerR regulator
MAWTVSQVAKLAGISVRTLHHYDALGLVQPSERSDAGYRLYREQELVRLQQVLFFKELGFGLEEIHHIVTDPGFDVGSALRTQRELLVQRAARVEAFIQAVDAALDSLEKGKPMKTDAMFGVFGDFDPQAYEEEAKQQWGDTKAYKESKRRTKNYTRQDWERIKDEHARIYQGLGELMRAGKKPDDAAAMDLAEAHRHHIDKWFYPCPHEHHRVLADMWVGDPRFAENIDRVGGAGVTQFARDAVHANAYRGER